MNYFAYKDGVLDCEEVSLEAIADSVGTPAYVYSGRTLQRHVRVFDEAFGDVPHLVCYAIKANSNLSLLRRFVKWGIGFEVVSGGELFRALKADAPPDRIIFSGVGKTADEIRHALVSDVLFLSVESRAELELISEIARDLGKAARVVFRINPDVDAQTHPYISTGLQRHKFGIAMSEAREVFEEARQMDQVRVVGVGCHIGSQITELEPFQQALSGVGQFTSDLQEKGFDLQYLDFGGGLGISYDSEEPPSPDAYAGAVLGASRELGLTLVLEPGRVIVGNAGILLCKVVRKKNQGGKQFVIVDAGMNDLLRPALYGSYHRILPVRPREDREVVDIVGPICESSDFLAQEREVQSLEPGDLLAVMSAGAYGYTLASNYNSRPRPPEVLVDGNNFDVVGRRETYEDLIRLEE